MTDSYLTIARDATAEIEVKRSRFICALRRAESEDDARSFIESVRREHWDARHNCSAFVIGPHADTARSNDDGEPPGTAGAPMLDVLRAAAVSDCVAVVTRYFGGILLGTGGLARAYGEAVRRGLDEAGVLERRLVDRYRLDVPHADAGRVENELRARGVVVSEVTYADHATFTLGAGSDVDLPLVLAEVSGGTLTASLVGSDWVDAR